MHGLPCGKRYTNSSSALAKAESAPRRSLSQFLERELKSPASLPTVFTLLCERKKPAPEALAYNGLVQSWPEIVRLAHESQPSKAGLFGRE